MQRHEAVWSGAEQPGGGAPHMSQARWWGTGLYSGEKKFPGKNGNIKKTSVFFLWGLPPKRKFPGKNGSQKKGSVFLLYFFSAIFLKRSDGNMHVLLQVKGGMLHWHSRIFTY